MLSYMCNVVILYVFVNKDILSLKGNVWEVCIAMKLMYILLEWSGDVYELIIVLLDGILIFTPMYETRWCERFSHNLMILWFKDFSHILNLSAISWILLDWALM